MYPVHCQIKHDPEAGTYGDCVRACVATIMEFTAERVPHFHEDNPGYVEANRRLTKWLKHYGYAPVYINCGDQSMDDILSYMGEQNPDAHYMLFGRNAGGDHVVVCHGGAVVHDPNWCPSPMVGPGSSGVWVVMVIARS